MATAHTMCFVFVQVTRHLELFLGIWYARLGNAKTRRSVCSIVEQ